MEPKDLVKKKYQIFTPLNIVNEMLNGIDYFGKDILQKTIMESSCGTGNILEQIVERYIIEAKKNNYALSEIKNGLESNIFGVEKDIELFELCIERLQRIAEQNGLFNIKWNIRNGNGLLEFNDRNFDFNIGNPPYIRYHTMSYDLRDYLKNNYTSCSNGSFDYYFAFVENALSRLKIDGQMVFILPGSILNTKAAKGLRILLNPYVYKIHDFRGTQIFKNISTSSVIIYIKKSISQKISYTIEGDETYYEIEKEHLDNDSIWTIYKEDNSNLIRFSSLFRAQSPVATQANHIYVLNSQTTEELNIEKNLLKINGSPRSLKKSEESFIIFPYKYENGNIEKYTDEEFEFLFPNTTKYLNAKINDLSKRDSDKYSKWFEYGRGQSLKSIDYPKLVLSTSISYTPKIYYMPKDTVVSGGIIIISVSNFELNVAKNILTSPEFLSYAQNKGVSLNNNYIRITSSLINNFLFSKERFNEWVR